MNIGPRDLVLEIGSGHNPKTRADVLCDRHLLDDTQRGGRIVMDRPFVVADGERLPFRDRAFDYVICCHVVEHAEDAERFLREVERVGRAGYIETPSEIGELLYGWPYHRWCARRVGDTLVLRRKAESGPFGQLFHALAREDGDFARFHRRRHALLLVRLEWRGTIPFEVRTADAPLYDLRDADAVWELIRRPSLSLAQRVRDAVWSRVPAPWRGAVKGVLSAVGRVRRPSPNLRELLVCPRCHSPLVWGGAHARCAAEGLEFPIADGVPVLLLADEDRPTRLPPQ
jgi:uncharacterized protein YbaR (Trm112 family)/SAM-dependent methyltransferase